MVAHRSLSAAAGVQEGGRPVCDGGTLGTRKAALLVVVGTAASGEKVLLACAAAKWAFMVRYVTGVPAHRVKSSRTHYRARIAIDLSHPVATV